MAKGLLKYMMLRTISVGEATGYELIKQVANVTGSKPSTGSVYPMLKSMEDDGWIEGTRIDGKTLYSITRVGVDELSELEKAKSEYITRIHQSISVASVTFEDSGHLMHLAHMEIFEVLEPVLLEVGALLESGVDENRISEVVDIAAEMLRNLREGASDE